MSMMTSLPRVTLLVSGVLWLFILFSCYPSADKFRGYMPSERRVGKVTMVYGDNKPIYERAINTHKEHSDRLGYPLFVLRRPILEGVWNKNAILLSLILQELEKPAGQRLEWLFWFDSDTVLMNPNMPLETFLPPPSVSDVHMLLTYDWNGMNNGAFFLRVHPWSVELLSAAIAYPIFKGVNQADSHMSDQDVLGYLLEENESFSRSVEYAPMRWFNAYMCHPTGEINSNSPEYRQVHRGDLLIHFPGTPRDRLSLTMEPYLQIAESRRPEWELSLEKTGYVAETKAFWASVRPPKT